MEHHDKHKIHIPVPKKLLELRPMDELMAIVKRDLRKLDAEGLIDDGVCIKTVMACNERLGISIRDIKQICIPVHEYQAKLPLNFEKLFFVTALSATNGITVTMRNPFSNNFDRDAIYEAHVDRDSLGCPDCYGVTIKRTENITVHASTTFIELGVSPASQSHCHTSCPNTRRKGKYMVTIEDDHISTPFRSGEIYIMYLATMQDEDGHLLFPFHPLITPYYEWSVKEKIWQDTIFNSDGNYGEQFKLAQQERVKAWLDAYNVASTKEYGEYVDMQRRKEMGWYNQYFKYFQ
jgi:hypothetical protein